MRRKTRTYLLGWQMAYKMIDVCCNILGISTCCRVTYYIWNCLTKSGGQQTDSGTGLSRGRQQDYPQFARGLF